MKNDFLQDIFNNIDDNLIVDADKETKLPKNHLVKWIAIAVTISILISASIISIVAVRDYINKEQQTTNITTYSKIHFYISQPHQEHETIDSVDELLSVLNLLSEYDDDYYYKCTIWLNNNLENSDEYKELVAKKDTINSPLTYQQMMFELIKKIDDRTVDECLPMLSECAIQDLHGIGGAPVVVGTILKDNLTIDLIKTLADFDFTGSIYISLDNPNISSIANNIVFTSDNSDLVNSIIVCAGYSPVSVAALIISRIIRPFLMYLTYL